MMQAEECVGTGTTDVKAKKSSRDRGGRKVDVREPAPSPTVEPSREEAGGVFDEVGQSSEMTRPTCDACHELGHLQVGKIRSGDDVPPAGLGESEGPPMGQGHDAGVDDRDSAAR
jgi:hypothetical protein